MKNHDSPEGYQPWTNCQRCGKRLRKADEHFGLCCACVEYVQEVQDVTEARHRTIIDTARDVAERLGYVLALRDHDAISTAVQIWTSRSPVVLGRTCPWI